MNRYKWVENFEEILKGNVKVEYNSSFRKLILKNNIFPYKCNKCGINKWNNEFITLEIEHKDGDKFNNSKENLELLCPNCHSQTPTFRKNRKKVKETFIQEDLIIKEFKNSKNINQLLLKLGLDNSGGNYKRIKSVLEKNKLIFQSINKIDKKLYNNNFNKEKLIQEILNNKVDFSKKTWGVELSKTINKSPQYLLKFVKTNLPYLLEIEKPIIPSFEDLKKERLEKYNNSGLDDKKHGFYADLGRLFNISTWAAKNYYFNHIKIAGVA